MTTGHFVAIVREACFGLYHHRFRPAQSMLGISWGILSVVVLLSSGAGFRVPAHAGRPTLRPPCLYGLLRRRASLAAGMLDEPAEHEQIFSGLKT